MANNLLTDFLVDAVILQVRRGMSPSHGTNLARMYMRVSIRAVQSIRTNRV